MNEGNFYRFGRRDFLNLARLGLGSVAAIILAGCASGEESSFINTGSEELITPSTQPSIVTGETLSNERDEPEGEIYEQDNREIISIATADFVPIDSKSLVLEQLLFGRNPALKIVLPLNLMREGAELISFQDGQDNNLSKLGFNIPKGLEATFPSLTYPGKVIEVVNDVTPHIHTTRIVIKVGEDSVHFLVTYSINSDCIVLVDKDQEVDVGQPIFQITGERTYDENASIIPQVTVGLKQVANPELESVEPVDLSIRDVLSLLEKDDAGNRILVGIEPRDIDLE